jgi:predicted metallo-beta-lactamase superfamily hydrolase
MSRTYWIVFGLICVGLLGLIFHELYLLDQRIQDVQQNIVVLSDVAEKLDRLEQKFDIKESTDTVVSGGDNKLKNAYNKGYQDAIRDTESFISTLKQVPSRFKKKVVIMYKKFMTEMFHHSRIQ